MARQINITIPSPKIELTNAANWKLTQDMIDQLPKAIQRGYDKGSIVFANRLNRIIKRAIQSGNPPPGSGISWKPLKKGGHAIYYLKGEYSRAIGIYKYKSRVLVGMPIGMKHYGGLTYNQLATLLEYGGGNIPARPLWRPATAAAGGTKELKRILMKEIRSSLISKTGLNANQIKAKW